MSHHLLNSLLLDKGDGGAELELRMDNRFKRAAVPSGLRNEGLADVAYNTFVQAVTSGLNCREAILAVYLGGFEHAQALAGGERPVSERPLEDVPF